MSRLPQLSDAEASEQSVELFNAVKQKLGVTPNIFRVIGASPAALNAHLAFGEALSQGALSASAREAIALTVAGINGCDYCASAHSAISRSLKIDDAEIQARLQGQSADPKINAITRLAKAIVETRGFVSDDDLAAARNDGLDHGEIVEVIANVATNIFTNYLNHVAQTEIDFPRVTTTADAA